MSPELVGRSAEVLVGGEAGIGKSRLVHDFTAGLDAQVLLGGCVELDGLPFAPFVGALRGVPVSERERADPEELLPAGVARSAPDAAAVAGVRVSHALSAKIVDTTAVESTVDGGVPVVGGDGYAFRHALIRDAVHRRLLPVNGSSRTRRWGSRGWSPTAWPTGWSR